MQYICWVVVFWEGVLGIAKGCLAMNSVEYGLL